MAKLGSFLVSLLFGLSVTAATANEHVTVFENVHVLTMQPEHQGQILRQQTVVIQGDRIIAMGAQGDVEIPAHAQRITGEGRYLLPGLAEMHGHVPPTQSFTGIPERYLDDVLYLYLAGGVTTVRGMLWASSSVAVERRYCGRSSYWSNAVPCRPKF